MSGEIFREVVDLVQPLIEQQLEEKASGRVLVGTVSGDIHDIGKNMFGMLLSCYGFDVIDLGVDVNEDTFNQTIAENPNSIVGLSALLTTTMGYMATVIETFQKEGLDHIKMCVGGAPVTQMFADEIGADGYANDAAGATDLFLSLVHKHK